MKHGSKRYITDAKESGDNTDLKTMLKKRI